MITIRSTEDHLGRKLNDKEKEDVLELIEIKTEIDRITERLMEKIHMEARGVLIDRFYKLEKEAQNIKVRLGICGIETTRPLSLKEKKRIYGA